MSPARKCRIIGFRSLATFVAWSVTSSAGIVGLLGLTQSASASVDTSHAPCQTRYFVDAQRSLTPGEVLRVPENLWSPGSEPPNLGFSPSFVWVDLRCAAGLEDQRLVAAFEYPSLDAVDVFSVTGNQTIPYASLGDSQSPMGRFIPHRKPAFPIETNATDSSQFVIRIATTGSMQTQLHVSPRDEFEKRARAEAGWFGLYYGVIFAIFFYNLALFVVTKKRTFLAFCCFVAIFGIFQMSVSGLIHYLFDTPWLQNSVLSATIFLIQSAVLFFSATFLSGVAKQDPLGSAVRVQRRTQLIGLLESLGIMLFVVALGAAFLPFGVVAAIGPTVGTLIPMLVISIALAGPFERTLPVWIFVLSWATFLTGVAFLSLANVGYLTPGPFATNAVQAASALQTLLLSIALGLQWRQDADSDRLLKEKTQSLTAIARTTHALAHDVRKPFSMLKGIVQSIGNITNDQQLRQTLRISLEEVNLGIATVENVIQSVMHLGRSELQERAFLDAKEIIQGAVNRLRIRHPASNPKFSYKMKHRHLVDVDANGTSQVFEALLEQAFLGHSEPNHIWFATAEEAGFVIFTVGFNGRFIEEDKLKLIFDAFAGANDRGKSAIGLAIAKHIVSLHQGSVQAKSWRTPKEPEGILEFTFTLPATSEKATAGPASDATSADEEHPPDHQHHESDSAASPASAGSAASGVASSDEDLLQELIARIEPNGVSLEVLLVDDEAFYRKSFAGLIETFPGLADRIELRFASNSKQALELVESNNPALIVLDVDLGTGSSNGIALLTTLRSQGYKGSICVHSNRFLSEDHTRALHAGASAVIAKPMSRSQLIALLLGVTADPKPCFAYIDDSVSFLIGMRLKVKLDCDMLEFRSSSEFFERIDQDQSLLGRLDFVLTDYYFASGDPHDGKSLAKALRAKGYSKPILLASSGDFLDATPGSQNFDWPFDACIPKLITEWDELKRHVQKARTKSNT